jgi:hypothetical protein
LLLYIRCHMCMKNNLWIYGIILAFNECDQNSNEYLV